MVDNTINSIVQQLGVSQTPGKTGSKELGQDDFLKILVKQLEHQDPFQPQDNADFIGQMAQFGTVEGIGKLQESFSSLSQSLYSNQALQASALVGRTVEVPSDVAELDPGKGITGAVKLDLDMQDITLEIKDGAGATVKKLHLGNQTQGLKDFHWDGHSDTGESMPAGIYTLQASGDYLGTHMACNTMVTANVNSVTLGQRGNQLSLNVNGLGDVSFKDVVRIT